MSPLEAWWRSSHSVQKRQGKQFKKNHLYSSEKGCATNVETFSPSRVQPLSTRGCCLTFGWLVSMLYHRMEAQALGIWQMFEMTTTGREWVCTNTGNIYFIRSVVSFSLLESLVITCWHLLLHNDTEMFLLSHNVTSSGQSINIAALTPGGHAAFLSSKYFALTHRHLRLICEYDAHSQRSCMIGIERTEVK